METATRRSLLKSGVLAAFASVLGIPRGRRRSDMALKVHPAPTAQRVLGWFNVKDYGAVGNGTHDDTTAIQAAYNACGDAGGGTVYYPYGTYVVTSCIDLPASSSGTVVTSLGVGVGPLDPSGPGSRILASGQLGNQPTYGTIGETTSKQPDTAQYLFNADAYNSCAYHFVDLAFDQTGATSAILTIVAMSFAAVTFQYCTINHIGIGYFANNGNGQPVYFSLDHCRGDFDEQNGMFWNDTGPREGYVTNCAFHFAAPNGGPFTYGGFLEQTAFWSWYISNNRLEMNSNGSHTAKSASLWCDVADNSASETANTIVHDNLFDHAADAAIAILMSGLTVTGYTQGSSIHDNVCNDWGNASVTGGLGAAIYFDDGPQDCVLGPGTFYGNTTGALYGIRVEGDPVTANLRIDTRHQVFRSVVTAPWRINGVNYTAGAGSTWQGFRQALTAPAVPASGTALTNSFGVAARVFVTGGTVSAIAIGGTDTGLTGGTFELDPGETITLTYSSAPAWTWFGL